MIASFPLIAFFDFTDTPRSLTTFWGAHIESYHPQGDLRESECKKGQCPLSLFFIAITTTLRSHPERWISNFFKNSIRFASYTFSICP